MNINTTRIDYNIKPSGMWENASIYYEKGMSPSDYGNLAKRIIEEHEQNPKEVANVNGDAIFESDLDYIILYHYYTYSETKQVLDSGENIPEDIRKKQEKQIEEHFFINETETLEILVRSMVVAQAEKKLGTYPSDREVIVQIKNVLEIAREDAQNGGDSSIEYLEAQLKIRTAAGLSEEDFLQKLLLPNQRLASRGSRLWYYIKDNMPDGKNDDASVDKAYNEYVDKEIKNSSIQIFKD